MDFESDKREEAGPGLKGVPYLRIPCVDLSGGDAHFFPVSDLQYKYLSIIHGVVVGGGCDCPLSRQTLGPTSADFYLFIFIWSKQNINKTLLIINGSNYKDHLTPPSHPAIFVFIIKEEDYHQHIITRYTAKSSCPLRREDTVYIIIIDVMK